MSRTIELQELFERGKISRREFLARLSALGAAVAASAVFPGIDAFASTPKRGGRLRIAADSGSTSDTLDPAITAATMTSVICAGMLYNYLVEIDADNQAIPELAESWETNATADEWVFQIRKGVEFHNGKSLTAEDVLFSMNHHRGEDKKSGAKGVVKTIKEIKTDGKYTIIFTLNEGNADFPYLVSDYHLGIIPAGTTDAGKGIGTGGYQLVEFEPGVRCLVKRNPNYWKTGRAHFDEVETISIADVTARINALKTDKVDYMSRVDTKTAKFLEQDRAIQLSNIPSNYHYTFPMLTDVPPFDNNDLRLALKYAVDREILVTNVLSGYGTVGNDHPIGARMKYFAKDLPQRKFDPDKAKFHLKKAGMEGRTFELTAADGVFPGSMDAAVLYQERAAKAGVNIKIKRVPNDGYWKEVWRKAPWCLCYWGGRPTADWMFSAVYAEGVDWNDTHFKHEKFNTLLKAARAELDEQKRATMYAEMQRIVRDEGGVVIPMFANILEAGTTKLGHGKIASNFTLDGFRLPERWWFKS